MCITNTIVEKVVIAYEYTYSGNIFNLFQKYENKYYGLIVFPYVLYKYDNGWMWFDCFTEEYRK